MNHENTTCKGMLLEDLAKRNRAFMAQRYQEFLGRMVEKGTFTQARSDEEWDRYLAADEEG